MMKARDWIITLEVWNERLDTENKARGGGGYGTSIRNIKFIVDNLSSNIYLPVLYCIRNGLW